jgi:ATP-dependent RNA helicase RhlE
MKFTELRLAEPIVRAVLAQGYETPTPIQAQSIPEALNGRDVLGCAQTGTGKTCAFALPILHRLSENKPTHGQPSGKGGRGRSPRALVLCPTRELATQIFDSFKDYSKHLNLRHTVVYGGVPQGRQVRALREGIDVLVATPGRLLDLINQGHIDLSQIEVLVLDEADRMLDMGFITDIRKVVGMLHAEHQTLFFSATVSKEIRKLADSILDNPVSIETAPESTTAELIAQRVYTVMQENKAVLLNRLLRGDDVGRTLVFTRTKHGADKLCKILNRDGLNAEAIHGNKTQNARTRTMRRFKTGATAILVATDVASRGIDVDEITHVVNFDMPIDSETYVHRIGRTARAGASGIAISLCSRDELGVLRAVERRTRNVLEIGTDHDDLTFEAPQRSSRGPATHYTRRKPNFNDRSRQSSNRNRSGARSSRSNDRNERSERSQRDERVERKSHSGTFDQDRPSRGERSDRIERSERGEFPNHGKPGGGVRKPKPARSDRFKPVADEAEKPKKSKPKKAKVKFGAQKSGEHTHPLGRKAKTTGKKKVKKTGSKVGNKPSGVRSKSNANASATPNGARKSGGSKGHRKGQGVARKSTATE